MTTEEALRKAMDIRGVRFMDLAERMGIATNTLAGRIKSKNISVDKLNDVLEALDYEIVLMPTGTELNRYEFRIK